MKRGRSGLRQKLSLTGSLIAALCCATAALAVVPNATLDDRIGKECARLEVRLAGVDASALPEGFRGAAEEGRAALSRVRGTSAPELKLYRLRDAYTTTESIGFVYDHRAAGKALDQVRALWNERRGAYDKKLPSPRGSALARGLSEQASNRAGRYFRASLPYATASGPFAGLYYLGLAEGNRGFSTFAASLCGAAADQRPAPTAASLGASLNALDAETIHAFDADPAGQTMTPVSAMLKESRELLHQRLTDGAALTLLEARLGLSRRLAEASHVDASTFDPAGLGSHTGDSLHDFLVAWAREEKGVRGLVIQRDVLPLYRTMFTPAPVSPAQSGSAVVVTLIRWPYT